MEKTSSGHPLYILQRHLKTAARGERRSDLHQKRRNIRRRMPAGRRIRIDRRRKFFPHPSARPEHFPCGRPEQLALERGFYGRRNTQGGRRLPCGTERSERKRDRKSVV